jgi:hypothetical protein
VASERRRFNIFYALLLVVGVAFCLTACSYFVLALRDVRTVQFGATTAPARTSFMDFIDQHAVKLMAGQIVALAVLTVAAITTDRT